MGAAFVAGADFAAGAAFRAGGTLFAARPDDAGSTGEVASPGAAVAAASAALDRARDAAVLPAGVGLLMGMSGPSAVACRLSGNTDRWRG